MSDGTIAADGRTSAEYFERLYAHDPDPWRFASSEYERDKYTATLAALPPRRFARAFEIGCSIGVLTRHLAERCDALLGADVAEGALAQARERCAGLFHVKLSRMVVPQDWPDGRFDLIVFSEVLYYLGLPVGRDMDGYARSDLFRRVFTSERPIAFIPTHNR